LEHPHPTIFAPVALESDFAAQEPSVVAPHVDPPEQLAPQEEVIASFWAHPHFASPHIASAEQLHSSPQVSQPQPIVGTMLVNNRSVPAILSVRAKTPTPATRASPKIIIYFFIVIFFKERKE
jgi:hypothetical protein